MKFRPGSSAKWGIRLPQEQQIQMYRRVRPLCRIHRWLNPPCKSKLIARNLNTCIIIAVVCRFSVAAGDHDPFLFLVCSKRYSGNDIIFSPSSCARMSSGLSPRACMPRMTVSVSSVIFLGSQPCFQAEGHFLPVLISKVQISRHLSL